MAAQLAMFRKADADQSGTLDFEEFASMDCHKGMSLSKIREAFRRLDTDGNNTLTIEDFAKYRVRNMLRLDEYQEKEELKKRKEEAEDGPADEGSDDVFKLTEEAINNYSFMHGAKHDLF